MIRELSKMNRWMVIGPANCGKGEVCRLMHEELGYDCIASSYMAYLLGLFDELSREHGYKNPKEFYANRGKHREDCKKAIIEYNTPNAGNLGFEIFGSYNVYDGPRSRREFVTLSKQWDFRTLWVDSSERCGVLEDSTLELNKFDCGYILNNNGTPKETLVHLKNILRVTH